MVGKILTKFEVNWTSTSQENMMGEATGWAEGERWWLIVPPEVIKHIQTAKWKKG